MKKKVQTKSPETPTPETAAAVTVLAQTQDVDTDAYDGALSQLLGARQALAAVKSLPELKQIRDMAEALGRYTKQRQYGLEIENDAAEIRLIAERRLGDLLKKMQLRGGDRKSNRHRDGLKSKGDDAPLILADLGISRDQSKRWQREAALPEDAFQAYVTETKATGKELTSAAVLKQAKAYLPQPKPKSIKWSVEKDVDKIYDLFDRLLPHWQAQTDKHRIYLTLRGILVLLEDEEKDPEQTEQGETRHD
jgi:hypothetical protein